MNAPEYIVVDELANVTEQTKINNGLANLNYKYGYIKELDESLVQAQKDPDLEKIFFPLTWVEQPFKIIRGESAAYYGRIELLRIFLMMRTDSTYKAYQRMEKVYKETLYPIYRKIITEIDLSVAFSTGNKEKIKHSVEDRYYWGSNQESVLSTPVDCVIITIRDLLIANNPNCIPSYNFKG